MKQYDALLFDFGNVLIDLDLEGWKGRIADHVDPLIDPDHVRMQLKQLFRQIEKGEFSAGEFIEQWAPYMTLKSTDQLIDLWNSILVGIHSSIFAILEALRQRHKVYLLSNTNVIHLDWVYRHLEKRHQVTDWDERYFDGTFYSHLMHMRKPDSDIFNAVIKAADLTPDRTLFFDDDVDNVRAAISLGVHGYVKPPQRPIDQILQDLDLL